MALVAAVVRCSGTSNQMWPISMTPNSCVAALHRWRRRRAEARRASRASARGRAVQPASSRVERREGAQWARPGLKHTSISPLPLWSSLDLVKVRRVTWPLHLGVGGGLIADAAPRSSREGGRDRPASPSEPMFGRTRSSGLGTHVATMIAPPEQVSV